MRRRKLENFKVEKRKDFDPPKHSSTPGNKKTKVPRLINPDEITELEVKRADLEAARAIKGAADKIMEAANLIINCMTEFKPEIKSLANRNYREIQMSSNAIRQLVSIKTLKNDFFKEISVLFFLDFRSCKTRCSSSVAKAYFSR